MGVGGGVRDLARVLSKARRVFQTDKQETEIVKQILRR